ncbi:MAG TPA: hypothetical protein VK548_01040 [Candidatus Acidoferrum sp.]|nr:hypothetical protein [Candidatus Acidoferrum sp.]
MNGDSLTRLTVRLVSEFSVAMETLRAGWVARAGAAAGDEFDERSRHVIVHRHALPAGMVRITMGEPSILATWSRNAAPLPRGAEVAELTRGVVAPPARRLGIYRLAMLETVLRLRTLGASIATAAVEPDFPGLRFLGDLGFVAVGRPVLFDDAPRSRTVAQAIVLEVEARHEDRWLTMWQREVGALLTAGYRVDSDLMASIEAAGRAWPVGLATSV